MLIKRLDRQVPDPGANGMNGAARGQNSQLYGTTDLFVRKAQGGQFPFFLSAFFCLSLTGDNRMRISLGSRLIA
jgi:hypothetical protein